MGYMSSWLCRQKTVRLFQAMILILLLFKAVSLSAEDKVTVLSYAR